MELAFKFRHWCENEAVRWRRKLNLYAYDPLPAARLAACLGVRLVHPGEIPGFDSGTSMKILEQDSGSWSAVVLPIPGHPPLIIYNPYHAPTRHESNIMHELAHLILRHKPIMIQANLPFLRQSYKPDDEEEAAYLGSCLQITKNGLDWAFGRGLSKPEIARHFGASEELVQFRLNMTGRNRFL